MHESRITGDSEGEANGDVSGSSCHDTSSFLPEGDDHAAGAADAAGAECRRKIGQPFPGNLELGVQTPGDALKLRTSRVGESKLLVNPADDHTKKVFDPSVQGHTDQFIYKFRKPG